MDPRSLLLEKFDRVVCINLDRRKDRWTAFQERLRRCRWPFQQPIRFRAVDGDRVTAPRWFQAGNGAWGCLQSHLRILEEALMDNVTTLLILEDDATFPAGFLQRSQAFLQEVPDDWDALMLGGQHLARPIAVTDRVVQVTNGNRTHAHALRGRYVREVYRFLCDYDAHVKTPEQHIDHRLGSLHFSGRFHVYAPFPWLIGQAADSSDISGRKEEERFWSRNVDVRPRILADEHNKRRRGEPLPLVTVIGLYQSGAPRLVEALLRERGYLGRASHDYFEEIDLADLCRNCFAEPGLVELIPRRCRPALVKQWLAQHRKAAPQAARFVVANHPLLALLADDLREAAGGPVKFVYVNRDFEDAVNNLESMSWRHFRGRCREAQQKLQQAIDRFIVSNDVITVDHKGLQNDLTAEADRVVEALGCRELCGAVA